MWTGKCNNKSLQMAVAEVVREVVVVADRVEDVDVVADKEVLRSKRQLQGQIATKLDGVEGSWLWWPDCRSAKNDRLQEVKQCNAAWCKVLAVVAVSVVTVIVEDVEVVAVTLDEVPVEVVRVDEVCVAVLVVEVVDVPVAVLEVDVVLVIVVIDEDVLV